MKPVRIKEHSWLARVAAAYLGFDRVALVIGHTIYLHGVPAVHFLQDKRWLRHELKHIEQYMELGTFRFIWRYLRESFRSGYYENIFEREARAAESDEQIIGRYFIEPDKRRT